jgi:hypothetical protein
MYTLILILFMSDGTAIIEQQKETYKSSDLCHWEGSAIINRDIYKKKARYPDLKSANVFCGYRYEQA